MPRTTARRVAWELLRAVHSRGAYSNLTLPGLLASSELDQRDRALAAELGYGALRAEGTLDHVLALCSSRPLEAVNGALLDVLRIGAYQLLRTRVPAHAAVSTAVDLAHEIAGPGAAKFANAVLRAVGRRDGDLGAPAYDDDPVGHLAVTTAHPRWVVEAFRDALDGDLAETRLALAADDERPEVHLAARPGRITRDELMADAAAAGLDGEAGRWSPYAVRLVAGDPSGIAAVRDGRAGVQDEGSQLCAQAVATGVDDGEVVLDMCAGPGGKAAIVLGLLRERGRAGRLLAADVHPHRAALVRSTLGEQHQAAVVCADGRRGPWRPGAADRVLLDAPCTGLGALRRRPEVRWRRQARDVAALARLQRELLDSAIATCRPGGLVAYVVCSPHLAESRDLVAGALADHRAVTVEDARAVLPGVAQLGPGPFVQLWPHRHGTDAMFLALLRAGPARR